MKQDIQRNDLGSSKNLPSVRREDLAVTLIDLMINGNKICRLMLRICCRRTLVETAEVVDNETCVRSEKEVSVSFDNEYTGDFQRLDSFARSTFSLRSASIRPPRQGRYWLQDVDACKPGMAKKDRTLPSC
jgi:hypothetical protein